MRRNESLFRLIYFFHLRATFQRTDFALKNPPESQSFNVCSLQSFQRATRRIRVESSPLAGETFSHALLIGDSRCIESDTYRTQPLTVRYKLSKIISSKNKGKIRNLVVVIPFEFVCSCKDLSWLRDHSRCNEQRIAPIRRANKIEQRH